MILVKHPRHGCRHVAADEVSELVAAGWTRFPRTRAEKAAGSWPPPARTAAALIGDALGKMGIEPSGESTGAGLRALNAAIDPGHGEQGANLPTCAKSQVPCLVMPEQEIPVFIAPPASEARQARQKPGKA